MVRRSPSQNPGMSAMTMARMPPLDCCSDAEADDPDRDRGVRPGKRAFDIYSRLLEKGYFFGEADQRFGQSHRCSNAFPEAEDPEKDIYGHQLPGGSVCDGLESSARCNIRPDITVCVGLAASMGAFFCVAGEGQAQRSSALAHHDPSASWGSRGQASDVRIQLMKSSSSGWRSRIGVANRATPRSHSTGHRS